MTAQKPRSTNETFINIQENSFNHPALPKFSLFEFAFRPFFLFAGIFSVIHLLLWVFVWLGKITPQLAIGAGGGMTPFLWHAHEMVFGYGYAVIIGFLLTAVTNWTGQKTLIHKPLMLMVAMWTVARIGFMFGGQGFIITAITDSLLSIWFIYEFTRPVIIGKNNRQWGFVGKLVLFVVANALFYAGLFGLIGNGQHYGVYLGLYLVLAIVMVMGRRVIPFFTKRGLFLKHDIPNPKWLDNSSLVLFTAFTIWDTFFPYQHTDILAWVSLVLFFLYSIRLVNWYQKGLFKVPLIWVLWLSNAILYSGFLIKALSLWGLCNPYLAIHAFTLGGIGLMTVGMMARVSLGHSGRNIHQPHRLVPIAFILMILSAIVRVLLPIALPSLYKIWIMTSVTLWVLSMLLFLIIYAPILIRPRADGKPG